jgi:hypothetical protein
MTTITLIGMYEISKILGISTTKMRDIIDKNKFRMPKPHSSRLVATRTMKLWDKAVIEDWIKNTDFSVEESVVCNGINDLLTRLFINRKQRQIKIASSIIANYKTLIKQESTAIYYDDGMQSEYKGGRPKKGNIRKIKNNFDMD